MVLFASSARWAKSDGLRRDLSTGSTMWTELLCVASIVVIAAAVVVWHVRCERAGEMDWASTQWKNLVCDQGGKAGLIAAVRLSMCAYASVTIGYMASSKVKDVHGTPALGGVYTFCTFTVWSWTLIAVYLGIAGVASALHALGLEPSQGARTFSCAMWVFFEVMFSCAILVFLVVWLVLLPSVYISTGSDGGFLGWTVLSAHNLNLVFMVVDCALNGFHFHGPHMVFTLYYGIAYVVFSWFWYVHSHVFYYFFIDWRNWFTPFCYLGLIGVLHGAFRAGACLSVRMKGQSAGNEGPVAREVLAQSRAVEAQA